MLADAPESHDGRGLEELPYLSSSGAQAFVAQHIDSWHAVQRMLPGSYVTDHYDFRRLRASLAAKLAAPKSHARAQPEVSTFRASTRRTRKKRRSPRFASVRYRRGSNDSRAPGLFEHLLSRPFIGGHQTAVVVGKPARKSGRRRNGRVKMQLSGTDSSNLTRTARGGCESRSCGRGAVGARCMCRAPAKKS